MPGLWTEVALRWGWMGAGLLAGASAALHWRGQRSRLAGGLLAGAEIVALVLSLLPTGWLAVWQRADVLAPALLALVLGGWCLAAGGEWRSRVAGTLVVASGLLAQALYPAGTQPATGLGAWFVPAQVAAALGVGSLLWAGVRALVEGRVAGEELARIVGIALWWLLCGQLCLALAAQLAWGSCWRWDALESWRLALLAVTTLLWWSLDAIGWRGRAAAVAVVALALLGLGVALAMPAYLHWLGIASAYQSS